MKLKYDEKPLCDGGPVGPGNALTLFTYFLVRGIEGAMAKVDDVRLDRELQTISWRLSVSKTDPAALGCERKWGCLCASGQDLGCPYHAASAQLELLCSLFGDRMEQGDLPLFPNAAGYMISGEGMNGVRQ